MTKDEGDPLLRGWGIRSVQLVPTLRGGRSGPGHSQRGAGCRRTGAGGGGVRGRPRRCSCPFTVSASEAALTRTSAIRLPPGLGPETGGGGAGLGAAREEGGSGGTDPLSGDRAPTGEGRPGRKSPGCLEVPLLAPDAKHSHKPRDRLGREGEREGS